MYFLYIFIFDIIIKEIIKISDEDLIFIRKRRLYFA